MRRWILAGLLSVMDAQSLVLFALGALAVIGVFALFASSLSKKAFKHNVPAELEIPRFFHLKIGREQLRAKRQVKSAPYVTPSELGQYLRHLRGSRGITLDLLARHSGMKVTTISRIENRGGALSKEDAEKIAKYLGLYKEEKAHLLQLARQHKHERQKR